jgi:lysyl-tRNA synthetase class 2
VTDDNNKPDEHKLIAERRGKLDALREQGNPFPNDFRRNATAGELHQTFHAHDKDALEEEQIEVSVGGRMMAKRVMGKASFIKLQDRSGQIQVRLERDRLPEGVYQAFKKWDVGDIVGANGALMRTNTGELTVLADEVRLLTKSLRPLPEKWAGLSDQETRYRQRYVDLIINEHSRVVFRKRSQVITYMRGFLESLDFLEVETPMMQVTPGGAIARPFTTHHNALDMPLYLRISDELYLKRLIVGGLDRVYEISKDFRNEGIDRSHNPEFTMLEWYRPGWNHHRLMGEVDELLQAVLGTLPAERLTYREAFERHASLDPHRAELHELRSLVASLGIRDADGLRRDDLLDLVLTQRIEGRLDRVRPTFIHDYPASQAALARVRDGQPPLAERFEVFCEGLELANGYHELVDPIEQRRRFEADLELRRAEGLPQVPIDERLIAALEHGLPSCSGVALGVDRLVMLAAGTRDIREVMAFPIERA